MSPPFALANGLCEYGRCRSKLAFNLNADEAAVMGAVLQGASLSAQFKTKEIRVDERALAGLVLDYEEEGLF